MKRRQLENRILFFIALVILILLYLVSESTVKNLMPLFFSSVIMLLPDNHRFFNNPLLDEIQYLDEETHALLKDCITGDYENAYDYITVDLIPQNERIRIAQKNLNLTVIRIDSKKEYHPYPLSLIKWIRELPTAHKADMLPETKIKNYQTGKRENIRIGKLIITD